MGLGSLPLTETGDRYVGRGTADMKGFLALATNRLAAARSGERLRRPSRCSSPMTRRSAPSAPGASPRRGRARARCRASIVIGEPTGLRVVRAHKGLLRLRLPFAARAAHSGYPHLGHNAIEPAGRAIVALAELRRRMEAERRRTRGSSPRCRSRR